ncbi:MAG TPA: TonB-dependent receptor [Phycisphaerales bacterium]|nr:TonB-dependent receptor [Phycisphaerales bacterium]
MKQNTLKPATLSMAIALSLYGVCAQAADTLEPIAVEAEAQTAAEPIVQGRDALTPSSTTVADLLKSVPGADVNRNGSLSGIAQYRGLFGERIAVSVNGQPSISACTNAMDAPLSYAPTPLFERLTVYRGVAPVSAAQEGIGGVMVAETWRPEFTAGTQGRVTAGITGVNNGFALGANVAVGSEDQQVWAAASREKADDADYARGTLGATEYERNSYELGYRLRHGAGMWAFEFQRDDGGPAGTPALPMDTYRNEADRYQIAYEGYLGGHGVNVTAWRSDGEHDMNNYTLRPSTTTLRRSLTSADDRGVKLDVTRPTGSGALTAGVVTQKTEHQADISDPTNPMFFTNAYNDVERAPSGAYLEWEGRRGGWELVAGARYTRVAMDAGEVDSSMAAMNPDVADYRDAFNAADRSVTDNNVNWALNARRPLAAGTELVAGVSRKVRSPSFQERYLWLPMESTGGLADGNLYVGDINLDPEVGHEIDLGIDWQSGAHYFTPRVFYRNVKDYIQGVPNGDLWMMQPVFQFTNVDAELYGFDAGWGVGLTQALRVDGGVSIVRGKRTDVDDNLYRIAPPNLNAELSYVAGRSTFGLEGVFYADQDNVAETSFEQTTSSYAIYNVSWRYAVKRGTHFSVGVDNVLDEYYHDHLAGYNRVADSDVPVGERLPGTGRNIYAGLTMSF